jgi:hypothetical protein
MVNPQKVRTGFGPAGLACAKIQGNFGTLIHHVPYINKNGGPNRATIPKNRKVLFTS